MVVSPFLGCAVTNCLLLLTSNSLLPPLSRGGFASSLTMPACSASVKSLPLEPGRRVASIHRAAGKGYIPGNPIAALQIVMP